MLAAQTRTARVITAAAAIMIAVFITFVFIGQVDIAEFGIGLAAAVALDAFVLRTVLVPTVMHRCDRANWWLPRWLDRRLPARLSTVAAPAQGDRGEQRGTCEQPGRQVQRVVQRTGEGRVPRADDLVQRVVSC